LRKMERGSEARTQEVEEKEGTTRKAGGEEEPDKRD